MPSERQATAGVRLGGEGREHLRLDALSGALASSGLPVTAAAMPEGDAGVLELHIQADDQAGVLAAIDSAFETPAMLVARGSIEMPKLFVSDMDSTMIGQECIDELADFAGMKAHVAAITERAMRGEIAFEPALRERVALLRGLPVSAVDAVIAERIRLSGQGITAPDVTRVRFRNT